MLLFPLFHLVVLTPAALRILEAMMIVDGETSRID